jgi:rod shape-determining protein MreD
VLLGFFVVAVFLQFTALNFIQIEGVKPDLGLVMVIFVAFLRGYRAGCWWGFVGGLLEDLYTGNFFGLNILTKMFIGCLVGLVEKQFYKDSLLVVVITTWFASMASGLVQYALLTYAGFLVSPGPALVKIILPVSFYNAITVPFLYRWFSRASKLYPELEIRHWPLSYHGK